MKRELLSMVERRAASCQPLAAAATEKVTAIALRSVTVDSKDGIMEFPRAWKTTSLTGATRPVTGRAMTGENHARI
jgi:hypothetical protein